MEKVIVTLSEIANQLTTHFADEIKGFECEPARLSLIFNADIRDYIASVTIVCRKGDLEKTLINSPLKGDLLCIESAERFIDVMNFEAKFRRRNLTAELVKKDGEFALALDFEPRNKICADIESAQVLIDDFMIICPEKSFKEAYDATENKSLKPLSFCGILKIGINVSSDKERFHGILVDVANSSVMVAGAPAQNVKELEPGRHFNPNPAKREGADMYFFNGKKIRKVDGDSVFMTGAEAKEIYDNAEETWKQAFTSYTDKGSLPALVVEEACYVICENPETQSVVVVDALLGVMADFNVNVNKTVKYCEAGNSYHCTYGDVFLSEECWKFSAKK